MSPAKDLLDALETVKRHAHSLQAYANEQTLSERRKRKQAENKLSEAEQEIVRLLHQCEMLGAELARLHRGLDALAQSVKVCPPSSREVLNSITLMKEAA